MSLDNFIPTVWSGTLLARLRNAQVYASDLIISRDYEGDISGYGDSVKINSIGPVTITDYVKNTNLSDPQTLADGSQTLIIDKAKAFNFAVDDIDKAQQNPKVMQEAMTESAYALSNVQDLLIAGLYTDASATNALGSDGSPTVIDTAAKAYENLVDLGVLLDEANAPTDGRWVVVPAWFRGRMQKDDRFVMYGTPATDARLRNGAIAEAAGFTIFMSNNVPQTAGARFKIIAGHKSAWNLAEQIVSVEPYRPEKRFGDAVKGLHVYGMKVTRPDCLAVLTANKA